MSEQMLMASISISTGARFDGMRPLDFPGVDLLHIAFCFLLVVVVVVVVVVVCYLLSVVWQVAHT